MLAGRHNTHTDLWKMQQWKPECHLGPKPGTKSHSGLDFESLILLVNPVCSPQTHKHLIQLDIAAKTVFQLETQSFI